MGIHTEIANCDSEIHGLMVLPPVNCSMDVENPPFVDDGNSSGNHWFSTCFSMFTLLYAAHPEASRCVPCSWTRRNLPETDAVYSTYTTLPYPCPCLYPYICPYLTLALTIPTYIRYIHTLIHYMYICTYIYIYAYIYIYIYTYIHIYIYTYIHYVYIHICICIYTSIR